LPAARKRTYWLVADLAVNPQDQDLQAALRVEIRRMLAADAPMVGDLREMLAGAPVITVTASGERSIAAQAITGVAATGDQHHHHPVIVDGPGLCPADGRADGIRPALGGGPADHRTGDDRRRRARRHARARAGRGNPPARRRGRRALPLGERALAITETALGPDQPITVHLRGNLAVTRIALDGAADAAAVESDTHINCAADVPDRP
jgi:hypothetical protein